MEQFVEEWWYAGLKEGKDDDIAIPTFFEWPSNISKDHQTISPEKHNSTTTKTFDGRPPQGDKMWSKEHIIAALNRFEELKAEGVKCLEDMKKLTFHWQCYTGGTIRMQVLRCIGWVEEDRSKETLHSINWNTTALWFVPCVQTFETNAEKYHYKW